MVQIYLDKHLFTLDFFPLIVDESNAGDQYAYGFIGSWNKATVSFHRRMKYPSPASSNSLTVSGMQSSKMLKSSNHYPPLLPVQIPKFFTNLVAAISLHRRDLFLYRVAIVSYRAGCQLFQSTFR